MTEYPIRLAVLCPAGKKRRHQDVHCGVLFSRHGPGFRNLLPTAPVPVPAADKVLQQTRLQSLGTVAEDSRLSIVIERGAIAPDRLHEPLITTPQIHKGGSRILVMGPRPQIHKFNPGDQIGTPRPWFRVAQRIL